MYWRDPIVKEGAAKEFLEYLEHNPAVRDVLQDAILEEIVAEGAARGFFFSTSDLTHTLGEQKAGRGWGT